MFFRGGRVTPIFHSLNFRSCKMGVSGFSASLYCRKRTIRAQTMPTNERSEFMRTYENQLSFELIPHAKDRIIGSVNQRIISKIEIWISSVWRQIPLFSTILTCQKSCEYGYLFLRQLPHE